MSKEALNKILALRKKLHEYNYEYYVDSRSLISDYEFDQLLKELELLEDKFPAYSDENSPTKREHLQSKQKRHCAKTQSQH